MSNLRDLVLPICHRDLMLATPAKHAFSKPGWIYELKYDGFRCLVSKRGDVVRLDSRNGNDMADRFPELVSDLRALDCDLVVDGELVMVDELGRPQWERLKRRHAQRQALRIRAAAAKDPAAIFAFDLLWKDGKDLRRLPLIERKTALHDALEQCKRVRYAGHFSDNCAELWAATKELGLEGIVAKDGAAIYSAGRSTRWLKVKTPIGAERERRRRP